MVRLTTICLLLGTACFGQGPKADSLPTAFFAKHCLQCHGEDAQEGGVSFAGLDQVTANNAELWKRVWEQVALKEMPPADEDHHPTLVDRLRLSGWITSQLQVALKNHGGFHAHRRPDKGNHLDHDLLFGPVPKGLAPASTPARIWRIHPQEHLTRLNELIAREPKFNPDRPGLRTRGDDIPPNREGEVKVY